MQMMGQVPEMETRNCQPVNNIGKQQNADNEIKFIFIFIQFNAQWLFSVYILIPSQLNRMHNGQGNKIFGIKLSKNIF